MKAFRPIILPTPTMLFLCGSVVACAKGTPPAAVTEADSSGVTIVTNSQDGLAAGAGWSLSAEPVVEIGGGVAAGTPLLQVTAIEPLGNGRVAVAMNAPPQTMVFDARGGMEALLGRQGGGPGEYSSVISVVGLRGDSIAVWDPNRRRITVFTAEGEAARQIDLSLIVPIPVGAATGTDLASGFTRVLGTTGPHLILFGEGALAPASEPKISRPRMPAHWIDTDGNILATSPPIPGMEVFLGSPIGPIPRPFGARAYATSQGRSLVVGTAEKTEFQVFGPDGNLARIVRWPDVPREVGGAFLTTWSNMVTDWVEGRADLAPLLESVPRAERWPAYMDLISSDSGEVLIGEYPGPTGVWPMRRQDEKPDLLRPQIRMPGRSWLVFDSTGVFQATLLTPEGFEAYAVRDGLIWGVYSDSLDIESVRAFGITRR